MSKASNILILTYCKHHAVSNEKYMYVRERYKKKTVSNSISDNSLVLKTLNPVHPGD